MKINYKQYHPEASAPGGGAAGEGTGGEAAAGAGAAADEPAAEGAPAAGDAKPAEEKPEKRVTVADLKNIPDISTTPDGTTLTDLEKKKKEAVLAAAATGDAGTGAAGGAAAGEPAKEEAGVLTIAEASTETELVDSTFIQLAEEMKDLGIVAPTEDSIEKFRESLVAWKDTEVTKAKADAPKEILKTELEKLPAPAQQLFEFLSVEGNNIEKYTKPLAAFDKYLSMEDEALVKENYIADGATPEEADKFVAADKLDEKIGINAAKVRLTLKNLRATTEQNLVTQAREATIKLQNEKIAKEKQELESFTTSLAKRKSFLKMPVADNAKPILVERYKTGVYRSRLANDPDLAVEVAMFIEFKDQYEKLNNNSVKDEGRTEVLKTLHNTGLPAGDAARTGNAENEELKGFDVWERKLADEKKNAQ